MKLSGIIYLHRITDIRVGVVSLRNVRMFRKLCGDDTLKNIVVVTSWWDDVQEKDRESMGKREKDLMETPGQFFEPLITAGGRFLRHDNTAESSRRIMEVFLKNHPIPLQTQLDGKAFKEIVADSEPEKRSSETKNLEGEVEALKKELEAERTKMQKEMTKWEEQKKAFAASLAAA